MFDAAEQKCHTRGQIKGRIDKTFHEYLSVWKIDVIFFVNFAAARLQSVES